MYKNLILLSKFDICPPKKNPYISITQSQALGGFQPHNEEKRYQL